MKTYYSKFYTAFLAVFVVFAFTIVGCEGPAGEDGEPGEPGKDGEEQCGVCHNSEDLIGSKQAEWAVSGHGTGTSYGYAGGRAYCAPCHAEQAYNVWAESSFEEASIEIAGPKPAKCFTCHDIHEDYSMDDFALKNTGAFELMGDHTDKAEVDFGDGNQCAKCHQARERNYDLVVDSPEPDTVSSHWGPHYGTQANIVAGLGGFEVGGGFSSDHAHKEIENSCTSCHVYGADHTFSPAIEKCQECHSGAEDFDYRNLQSDIEELIVTLEDLLINEGLLEKEEGDEKGHIVVGAVADNNNKMGSLFNYLMVVEDGSMGVHNPPYARQLLENSIAVFE